MKRIITAFQPRGVGRLRKRKTSTSNRRMNVKSEQATSNIYIYIYDNTNHACYRVKIQKEEKRDGMWVDVGQNRQLIEIIMLTQQTIVQYQHTFNPPMDDLSPQHYELVLKYMETANEDNFQAAALALKQHDYSLQQALHSKFTPQTQQHRPAQQERDPQSDQRIVTQYVQYVQRKEAEWSLIEALFNLVKTLVLGILGLLIRLLPTSFRLRHLGSPFERLYTPLPATFSTRSLPALLKLTRNLNSKSVLVVVSPPKKHPEVQGFLKNAELQRNLSRNFWVTGYVVGHADLAGIGNIEVPVLIALRQNLFQELKEIGRTKVLEKIDGSLMNQWAHEGRNLFKRDGNVLVKYRNFMNRAYGSFYQEQQQEEISLTQRELSSRQIQEQNKAYQQMQMKTQEAKRAAAQRRIQQQQQQRRKEQLEFERQARRSSIPDEPTEGEIVRVSFRCPDGRTIIRNFGLHQKLDMVYHWVELNEEIQFEDPHKRQFEIMHSYPPEPLSAKRDLQLREIFDSYQEKVVIREL